ncbi:MAG: hypothetical protein ACRDJX_11470 [Solirubrobacteraceae bacterium]
MIALPIALDGFGWWDAGVALVALPVIAAVLAALVMAVSRRLAPGSLASRHAICSPAGCSLIVLLVLANGAFAALTPANATVTIWVWLGASMLLAAARGYGGCEVLAVSNLISGRRDEIGCILYTPIDRFEAARKASQIVAPPLGGTPLR